MDVRCLKGEVDEMLDFSWGLLFGLKFLFLDMESY